VESALVSHGKVGEAAQVGMPDKVKEQGTCARVTPKAGAEIAAELKNELVAHVRGGIGLFLGRTKFNSPTFCPRQEVAKIMRGVMKSLLTGKELGVYLQ